MKLNESDHLNKEEKFERIKKECRSQAKPVLCYGVVFLIFLIAMLIYKVYTGNWKNQEKILYDCQLALCCFALGWSVVNYLRFFQGVNSSDTPKQLLNRYEKMMNNNRNSWYLLMLALTGIVIDPYAFINREWNWIMVDLILVTAMIAFLIYSYFKGDYLKYKTKRDEEIMAQLQELVEN